MRYINRFSVLPKELFRLNNGLSIALRDRAVKRVGSYDVTTEAGKVMPKALNPATYTAPNGASMRPNTATQKRLVKAFKASHVVIFAVPQGARLPDGLVLVHERSDHYSLQASEEMTLAELNGKITAFLHESGERLTKEQWFQRYPEPTESA